MNFLRRHWYSIGLISAALTAGWLGLAPVLFGFGQFIVHGVVTPRKLGSFYNPGLAAVLLLHFPIGGFYLYHLHADGVIKPWDWIIGIAYLAMFVFFGVAKATYS